MTSPRSGATYAVVVAGAVNAAALSLVVYSYLFVYGFIDIAGDTHWLNPPLVAVLTIVAIGTGAVSVSIGLTSRGRRSRRMTQAVATIVTVTASVGVMLQAVVTIT